ncbi:MAG: multidrug efflux RND transporter permease subunit [Betaproteobacteria bacterium]|nr:multidrug efflux RND transporter permease subunit [Betaproteobacteria bacterium]
MLSRFFIDRPIFAAVMSFLILIAGFAALRSLPVGQYPEIAPPVVTVTAVYPGASAEVLESTVAAPLEAQINGVEGMMYMSSTSASSGVLQIQVTFEIGSDADKAALNVNNRVKQAEARLPQEVRRQGVTVEKGSSSFLQVLAFYSPDQRFDDLYTSNYVTLNVLDRIKRIPGTTNVQIFGAKNYAMRIWLKPDRLSAIGMTPGDVVAAINEQNAQFAPGKVGQQPIKGQELVYTITTQGRLSDVGAFEDIIVRAGSGNALVRVRDIARVELGSADYEFIGRINGKPATLVGVFLQPGANALEVGRQVRDTLAEVQKGFPPGLSMIIPYDTTRFVEVSIHGVIETLVEAMVLVFLVVLLFLQTWRATLIPMLAVPVSLIGTFAGLLALGYTINTLTLFGLVLAIGIVVDDAIIVLENVERVMREEGLSPRDAAIRAMEQVTGPIIATSLVLTAVFVPVGFLGGLAGELYRQFAVSISIAVLISALVALTLSPALCAIILKPHEDSAGNRFTRWFNTWFGRFTERYGRGVSFMIRRGGLAAVLFGGMLLVTGYLWKTTPNSLVPDEDQGYYISAVFLPDGASLERTDRVVNEVVKRIKSNPLNEDVVAFTGFNFFGGSYSNSAATLFVTQVPWDQRTLPSGALVGEFYAKTQDIKEALALAFMPPAIFGLGEAGGFEVNIQNRGEGGAARLGEVVQKFLAETEKDPDFKMAQTLWRANTPQIRLDVDRDKAAQLGVPLDVLFGTLSATMGTYYVNDFNKYGRVWQVLMSSDSTHRRSPDDIGRIMVRSKSGQLIPLSTLVTVQQSSGPDTVTRFNNLPSVKILGSGAEGVSSGQALAAVERVAAKTLPPDFSYEFSGASFQEKRSSGAGGLTLVLAVVMVFLILAAQYERWSLPLAVLLALPFGTFGALALVWLRNFLFGLTGLPIPPLTNDVYFQIGLVTLLGLAAKNAILIVEFATHRHSHGMAAAEAALEAARLRFRPILMTSLAFILGVVPLALSTGAGAGARQSAGTGVMGGMLAATFLAIYFVPTFFVWVTRWFERRRAASAEGSP